MPRIVPALVCYDGTAWVELEDRGTGDTWRVTLGGWVSPAAAWGALGDKAVDFGGDFWIDSAGKLNVVYPDPYDLTFYDATTAGHFGFVAASSTVLVGGVTLQADNALTAYPVSHGCPSQMSANRGQVGFDGAGASGHYASKATIEVAGTPAQMSALWVGLESYANVSLALEGPVGGCQPITVQAANLRIRPHSSTHQRGTLSGPGRAAA